MNFSFQTAKLQRSGPAMRLRLLVLIWIGAFAVVGCLRSNLVSTLSYEVGNLSSEIRLPKRYRIKVASFALNENGPTPSQIFKLTMRVGSDLSRYGSFYSGCGDPELQQPLLMNPTSTQSSDMEYVFSANSAQMNVFLDCLTYERKASVNPAQRSSIEYRFTIDSSQEVDVISVTSILQDGLQIDVKPKGGSIVLPPNQVFSRILLDLSEPKEVLANLNIQLCKECTKDFYSLAIVGKQLVFQGHSPQSFAMGTEGRPGMALTFKIYDKLNESDGQTFSFWVELSNPQSMMSDEQLKLVLLAGIVLLLLAILGFGVWVWLKKERKKGQETVKKQINEPAVPENVLTKSILEWNKEATTTRDQTNKESVFYNPYEKYSLKKKNVDMRPQKKGPYSNLEKPEASPAATDQSSTMQEANQGKQKNYMIRNKSGPKGPSGDLDANPAGKVRMRDSAVSQQERLLQEQKYLTTKSEEMNEDNPKNLSQLEFSREENLNPDTAKKMRDLEFGDLSKIVQDQAVIEEEDLGKDPDLKLDEIILKEI